jgi:hypothetical protein
MHDTSFGGFLSKGSASIRGVYYYGHIQINESWENFR